MSARLSQPDGSPLEGVVDLRFELSYSGSPETIICTKDLTGTNLTNGLFQLGLSFSTAECGGSTLAAVLEGVPTSEAMLFRVVDVTDSANPRTYPFQSLKAVPLSVRSEVAQTLARNSAVEGQVLRFVGGEWVASNETAEVGTVSEINTGAGLIGGPITSSGTIAIASGGVTSAMVADGTLVDADISATANLARTKLSSGSPNYVLVNNASGVMSEVAQLPLSQGGTGAANASDARFNLGLGNAALRNVGLLAGELLDAGEIPSCALDEKIRKVMMPVAGFVCESGADATKLALTGGTMSGNIDMNANAITNLLDPSLAQDAATKAYVDGQIGGGAANQWSESGGNVYRTNGNVGIGTSNPTNALHLTERDDSWLSGLRMDRSYDSATDYFQMMYDFEGFKLRTMANDADEAHIIFKPLNVEALRISEGGNVGIGVIAPTAKLDVNGQIKISGGSPGAGKVLTSDASGLASWVSPSTTATPTGAAGGDLSGNYPGPVIAAGAVTDAKVAAGANIAQSKIANLTTDLAGKQAADTDLTGLSNLTTNGVMVRTGSGTYQTREVQGVANRTTVTNGNGVSGNPVINVSTALLPSPLAGDATRFLRATGANTTSWQALLGSDVTSALGYTPINKAGDSVLSGVFDFNSSAVLRSDNPVGIRDVANKSYVDAQVGGAANQWSASGGNVYRSSGNVGIGTSSPSAILNIKSSGASPYQGIVVQENFTNNTNKGAVAIAGARKVNSSAPFVGLATWDFGVDRQVYLGGGDWDMPSANILTFYTAPTADETIDAGIERMRITKDGNVGIGVLAPAAKLDINGQIKISGGTPGAGKVLTSDALGLASWQALPPSGTTGAAGGDLSGNYPNPVIATGAITDAKVAAGANIAQSKIANLTTDLAGKQAADTDLTAISALSTTGVMVRTGSGTYQTREVQGVANRTTVTNGNGVSANPVVNVSTALLPSPLAGDSTRFLRSTGANTATWQGLLGADITSALGYTPINKAGDTMGSGVFDFNSSAVLRVNNPVNTRDVANKAYVDGLVVGSSSLWTTSGSNIYRSSGNVGIGLSAPLSVLDVKGPDNITSFTGDSRLGLAVAGGVAGSFTSALSGIDFINANGFGADNAIKPKARIAVGVTIGGSRLMFGTSNNPSVGITNTAMVIAPNGNVGMGLDQPFYRLDVVGEINATTSLRVAGTQVCTSSGCTSSSDRRLKEDIKPIENALENILNLKGVEYSYIDKDKFGEQKQIGVIAQDVEKIYPEVVKTDSVSGFKSVAYSHLVAPLIESVKTLYMKITNLDEKQLSLERKIASKAEVDDFLELKKENERLRKENISIKSYLCEKDPSASICQ